MQFLTKSVAAISGFSVAIAVTVLLRKQRHSFRWSLLASICISLALIIWQLHNDPVNTAVETWTVDALPANWMTYRARWEYAHAARFGLYLLGFGASLMSVLVKIPACHSRSRAPSAPVL